MKGIGSVGELGEGVRKKIALSYVVDSWHRRLSFDPRGIIILLFYPAPRCGQVTSIVERIRR